MRRYVLASHGNMAQGMKSTLEIILGKQDNLVCVNAYTDQCPDPLPVFEKIIRENPDDEIIFMTDMLGGSVNNNAMVLMKTPGIHVITGINLAVVISIIMSDQEKSTTEVIKHAIEQAKEMIIYCNELTADEEDDDF